ncbi:MAG: N-acetylneuraminate synthase family protein [Bacteroidales bacterium]|nr:N-acetylneuraminate synthase family protein [Bacteroidales bacterium]
MKIAGKTIGIKKRVYIIAEIGSNHNQNIEQAKKLIDVASEAGSDAVKFQLFNTDSLYKPEDKLYKIFKKIELDPNWITILRDYAHSKDQGFIVSPFDNKSIDVLIENNVDALKWASSETVKLSLLKYAASKQKPMIISTGMCNLADIYEAVEICNAEKNYDVALLHCTSLYPTEANFVNIEAMETLSKSFRLLTGFSDHTLDNTASIIAVARGAKILEKHITLDKKMKGPDHFYAVDPKGFKTFVNSIRDAEKMLGSPKIEMHPKERKVARREGIYINKDLAKGSIINREDIEIRTPAKGIDKRYIDLVIDATLNTSILANESLQWKHIMLNK